MYIKDIKNKRNNNFDFIRFIAALLVLYSHSFPLLNGNENREPLKIFSKGDMTFGGLAVAIFFMISGYLISVSFVNSKNNMKFIKARVLRIFPALIVVLMLSTFILGPILTILSITNYFKDINTYLYPIKNITLILMDYDLPGVFDQNPFPKAVNGSLWTLWYEFLFYFIVLLLGNLKLLKKKPVLIIFIFSIFCTLILQGKVPNIIFNYIYLFSYFSAGILIFVYKDKINFKRTYALIALLLFVICSYFGFSKVAIPLFLSYFIFYISFFTKNTLSSFAKYGDFSYGIYIYAFPVQQTVIYLFGSNINFYLNLLIVTIVTLLLSIFSWHIVEKNALKYK